MGKVNEKKLLYHSMPVHNPLYKVDAVCFRGNIVKAEIDIEKPEVISGIVPEPLTYQDRKIFIVLVEVTELKEGFSEEDTVWNEIAIQIPVIHNGEPGLYICENYCSDILGIISSREVYGYPKVPARISIDKSGKDFKAGITKYGSNREVLNFTCNFLSGQPVRTGPADSGTIKKMPRIILLKYIPSATGSNIPDVKQLVTMKYNKPVIHNHMTGEGNIDILDGSPNYLKYAGITNPVHVSCLDMETYLTGGEVLHNYNS